MHSSNLSYETGYERKVNRKDCGQGLKRNNAEIDCLKQEADERFRHLQALFMPQEAEVYRKGGDVLIKAQGHCCPVKVFGI